MLPLFPVKKFGLGVRVSSSQNKSFNWLEWANPNTFDTKKEAEQYMGSTLNWNLHKNQNNPNIKNKYCGIMELNKEELIYWNAVVSNRKRE